MRDQLEPEEPLAPAMGTEIEAPSLSEPPLRIIPCLPPNEVDKSRFFLPRRVELMSVALIQLSSSCIRHWLSAGKGIIWTKKSVAPSFSSAGRRSSVSS